MIFGNGPGSVALAMISGWIAVPDAKGAGAVVVFPVMGMAGRFATSARGTC
jgi:hypothetical protein